MFISFQLCFTANSDVSVNVSLCEVNCIKIQILTVVLNLAEILCVLFTLT